MAKKCCHCSSFFSCFTCFSGNTHPPVDSSESATNLADASANTGPIACPESQSSSSANVAVNSNVSPAAATEEADQRRDDPVRTTSASAPPFQTSTSQEASSSSATTYTEVSDTIGNIHKAAQGDNGNVNLEALIEHISELLELIKDISGIQGLWFKDYGNPLKMPATKLDYGNPLEMPATKLDSMSNSLRILRFGGLKVNGKCEKRFEKLMFFQGEVAGLPFSISQIMTSNLKHMELGGWGSSHDFEIFPSDVQRLRNLRVLRLINFVGWRNLPAELGEIIYGLRELTLSACTSIEEIPRSISKLQYLRVLKLDGCYGLRGLPEDIGSLGSLQNLDLSHCKHIEKLPESTSKLRSLKELHMSKCEKLKLLPKDFESLDSLRVLTLYGCKGLQIDPKIAEKFGKIIIHKNKEQHRVALLVSAAALPFVRRPLAVV